MNANVTTYQRSVDVLGSDYISCPSHVNYFITNMCVNPVMLRIHNRTVLNPFVQNVSTLI